MFFMEGQQLVQLIYVSSPSCKMDSHFRTVLVILVDYVLVQTYGHEVV